MPKGYRPKGLSNTSPPHDIIIDTIIDFFIFFIKQKITKLSKWNTIFQMDAGPMVNKHNAIPKWIPALRSFQHRAMGMQAQ
jgi:hypothetical protein